MRVLVVGAGGREHALAWKLAQSPQVERVYAAPGNDGMASVAQVCPNEGDSIDQLIELVQREKIDLTVVGPEVYLVSGIVDRFAQAGLACFGPTGAAAQLEGSKAFSKAFMERHQIPTARYWVTTKPEEAQAIVREVGAPIVVKASGIAAGKGVVVAHTVDQALEAIRSMMVEREFGEAGEELVIEEFLQGEEVSILAICDGEKALMLLPVQDHKRIGEGETGPNTGGMGTYAPAPVATEEFLAFVHEEVLIPTLRGMAQEGMPYTGCLYAGMILTPDGPKVLEYNCRFGDPETQALLPLLRSDLAQVMLGALQGQMPQELEWAPLACGVVVLASPGYPGDYPRDLPIAGLDPQGGVEGVTVFHAGSAKTQDGWVTAGGRVLAVAGRGHDLAQALAQAYRGVDAIDYPGKNYRRDIGWRALQRKE